MPEACNPKGCPVSIRVEMLKEEFNAHRANSSKTHKELFQSLGELERAETAQEKHFKTANEKQDKLVDWQENQMEKPARRKEYPAGQHGLL